MCSDRLMNLMNDHENAVKPQRNPVGTNGYRNVLWQFRFWPRVKPVESGCWEWQGTTDGGGYGLFNYQSAIVAVHRFAYEQFVGPIPQGAHILHSCDNPPCCNPLHLRPGTHAENCADAALRGRARNKFTGATHCIRGHEFTPENTYLIPSGVGRACRQCKREWVRPRKAHV